MKHRNLRKVLIVLAVVFVVGVGTNALAGRGRGFCGGGGSGGYQKGGGGYACPNFGGSDISEDDWKKIDGARKAFFKDTEALRQQIYEKEMALRSELAKTAPDAAKAAELQTAISEHQGRFDQKHLDHMIKMRELNPNAGRGYMSGRGRMMGYGRGGYMMGQGRGYMMGGSGPRGGGSCWR
jgi:zinc resistance-associated protein